MAFTKINAAGIGTTETVTVDGLTVINDGSFGGNLTVSGVLTYEDVTNVDSVGLITARNGVVVGSGITLSKDGDIFATGVTTSTTFSGNFSGGTVSGTTGTFSGDIKTTAATVNIKSGSSINTNSDSSAHGALHKNTNSGEFAVVSGGTGGSNFLTFYTSASAAPTKKMTIDSGGRLLLNTTTEGNAGADDLTIGQISGSTGITIRSGTTNNGNLYFSDGTSGDDEYRGSIQYQHANNSLHIATNAVERLRISSGGQVRINTSGAPSADLHVGGTGGALNALFQTSRSSGAYHKYALGASGADLGYIGSAQQISSSGVASGFAFRSESHIEFCSGGSTERIRIDSLGRLFINKTTNRDKYFNGTYTGKLQVEGTDDTTRLTQLIHNSANASQHIFVLGKSRGGVGSYTSVQDGDYLGTISFQGADGDEMVDGARIEAQVNGSPGNDSMPTDLLFKTNTGGVSPTERFRIREDGKFFFGNDTSNQDSNRYVFVGTKAFSGGIIQGQLAVVDNNAYNTTDNGGAIGFQAKYHSNGAYTQMAAIEGTKRNNTDGDYGGILNFKVRQNSGNLNQVFYCDQDLTLRLAGALYVGNEINMINYAGTAQNKYFDSGHLNNTLHFRRTNGADGGHAVQMYMFSNLLISGDFNDTSDGKLKTNKVDLADGALSKVNQFKPVTFDWIDSTRPNDCVGFIAQDLKSVVPNLVSGTEYDETETDEKGNIISAGYNVNTIGVVAYLTKALQELSAKNDALEARIAALEG